MRPPYPPDPPLVGWSRNAIGQTKISETQSSGKHLFYQFPLPPKNDSVEMNKMTRQFPLNQFTQMINFRTSPKYLKNQPYLSYLNILHGGCIICTLIISTHNIFFFIISFFGYSLTNDIFLNIPLLHLILSQCSQGPELPTLGSNFLCFNAVFKENWPKYWVDTTTFGVTASV